MQRPMPAPSTKKKIASSQNGVSWSISDSRYRPMAVMAPPAIGKIRYFPVLPT